MSHVKFKFKHTFALIIIFIAIFIAVNIASPIYEPVGSALQKRQGPDGGKAPGGGGGDGGKAPAGGDGGKAPGGDGGKAPGGDGGKAPDGGDGKAPAGGDGKAPAGAPAGGDGKAPGGDGGTPTTSKKTIDPTATCSSPNDPRCQAPPGVTAKVETSTQDEVETITPAPTPNANNNNNNNNNNNGKNKITKFTTTTTTQTLYFAGYTSTITTTNSLGEVTTFATYIPPSTVLVVKKVAVTAPALEDGTDTSDSMTILHGVNNNSLWGVTMSLAVVTATLVFMIFA